MNIYVPAKIFADQKVVIKHVSTWIYLNRAFLYADYGMAASMDPIWLQGAFRTLTGLFNRLGLRTNVGKKVGMISRPFSVAGTQS